MLNEAFILIITSVILFILGIYGLSTRRNALKMLISIELLINAAALNIITFAYYFYSLVSLDAQIFVLFIIALAAAEAAIGLSIFLALHRLYGVPDLDVVSKLRETGE